MLARAIETAENGWIPDALLRIGIRRMLKQRLRDERITSGPAAVEDNRRFAAQMRASAMVEAADEANEQHYEVPTAFFERVLGPRLKYSCSYFTDAATELATAEETMLALTCERAGIEDGMEVLDLGCGWGSLALWIGQSYPRCRVLAVSNSSSQRQFIEEQCRQRDIENVEVTTRNVADLTLGRKFHRAVSVEMFEHVRNYEQLLRRIASWLRPDGKLFVHYFCHRSTPYRFEVNGAQDWMTKHFFRGGIMPSVDLLSQFEADLVTQRQWRVDGLHYSRTCEAWLRQLDEHSDELLQIFQQDADRRLARRRLERWRIFFLACSELFRFNGGSEWFVLHSTLVPARVQSQRALSTSANSVG